MQSGLSSCAIKTHPQASLDVPRCALNPAGAASIRETLLMKNDSFVAVLMIGSLAFGGCASETTSTAQSQTDQSRARVHTQEELRKTGESQTGPAVEKTDASIQTSGNR